MGKKRISLVDLVAQVYTYRCQWRTRFWNMAVQRAAVHALDDASTPRPITLPEYPGRVLWLNSPDPWGVRLSDPSDEPPPGFMQRVEQVRAEQDRMLKLVAEGQVVGLVGICVDRGMLNPDFTGLEQQQLYYPIKFHVSRAGEEVLSEWEQRVGDLNPAIWHYLVQWVLKQDLRGTPCNEACLTTLAYFACLDDLPCSDKLTSALARLDESGRTEELLQELWQQFPHQAEESGLPNPAEAVVPGLADGALSGGVGLGNGTMPQVTETLPWPDDAGLGSLDLTVPVTFEQLEGDLFAMVRPATPKGEPPGEGAGMQPANRKTTQRLSKSDQQVLSKANRTWVVDYYWKHGGTGVKAWNAAKKKKIDVGLRTVQQWLREEKEKHPGKLPTSSGKNEREPVADPPTFEPLEAFSSEELTTLEVPDSTNS